MIDQMHAAYSKRRLYPHFKVGHFHFLWGPVVGWVGIEENVLS